MSQAATVKIFLVHGDAAGLRTAEIYGWTGKAVAGPRSQLEAVLDREEADGPGVYFLTGVNPETGKERVYIGEAEKIRTRVKLHLERDFWKSVVFFVSHDDNFTKAHIKYLEGRAINKARDVARYEVENRNASGTKLPEAEAAYMDDYFKKVEQLLPLLGQEFLKPVRAKTLSRSKADLYFCKIKDVEARGRRTADGFIVFKGSTAVLQERPSTQRYPYAAQLRQQLLDEEVLIEAQGQLRFEKDHEFSSPSAAASVIHGGQANGLTAWVSGEGVTLKHREEAEASRG
jgi:hypothetical protein